MSSAAVACVPTRCTCFTGTVCYIFTLSTLVYNHAGGTPGTLFPYNVSSKQVQRGGTHAITAEDIGHYSYVNVGHIEYRMKHKKSGGCTFCMVIY